MEFEERRELDKTVGIVAYLTLIGWIVALVMNGDKQGEEKSFNAFHLRQMLGLIIFSFGSGIVYTILAMILIWIPDAGWILLGLIQLALFGGMLALWIIGLIGAANGQKREIPLLGGMIQKMLGQAFE